MLIVLIAGIRNPARYYGIREEEEEPPFKFFLMMAKGKHKGRL